jgi:hypothetical protein
MLGQTDRQGDDGEGRVGDARGDEDRRPGDIEVGNVFSDLTMRVQVAELWVSLFFGAEARRLLRDLTEIMVWQHPLSRLPWSIKFAWPAVCGG